MKNPIKTLAGLASITLALLGAAPAQAGPYSAMYVFGDSLSDTGNVFAATGGTIPAPPYYSGRFTNGPNWVDDIAGFLGLPSGATAAYLGGNNYAFGGARTGADVVPVPGLLAQAGGLWAPTHPSADPNALYVVVGGGNDMRDARLAYQTNSAADQAGRQASAAAAVSYLQQTIGLLYAKGARHVLLANLPDLGRTPEAVGLGLTLASTDATTRFNSLVGDLLALEALLPGLDVDIADWFGLGAQIFADPAAYGIVNTQAPCNGFPGSPNAGALTSCDVSAFSDALHPSALMHRYLADAAISALGVPEPGTAWLALVAVAAAAGAARRRRQA